MECDREPALSGIHCHVFKEGLSSHSLLLFGVFFLFYLDPPVPVAPSPRLTLASSSSLVSSSSVPGADAVIPVWSSSSLKHDQTRVKTTAPQGRGRKGVHRRRKPVAFPLSQVSFVVLVEQLLLKLAFVG